MLDARITQAINLTRIMYVRPILSGTCDEQDADVCQPDFLSTHHTIYLKFNEEFFYQKQKETQEGKLQLVKK